MSAAPGRHAEAFLEMLAAERNAAPRTRAAYAADLADFATYSATRGFVGPDALLNADGACVQGYLASLSQSGLSARTSARRLSCLRQFYRFLLREGHRADDPTARERAPKLPDSLPKVLSEDEMRRLLARGRAVMTIRGATWCRVRRWNCSTRPVCVSPNCCPCPIPCRSTRRRW